MRKPKPKKPLNILPPLIRMGYATLIMKLYSEKMYDEHPGKCPRCGCKEYTRYDKTRRIFARVITEEGIKDVTVWLKRYQCKNGQCGYVYSSKGPFYEGCQYGIPVVETALYFASGNPYNRVEKILSAFGIQLDKITIALYCEIFKNKVKEMAGIKMFDTGDESQKNVMAVNFMKLFFNVNNVKELREKHPEIKGLEGVADETYEAKKGAKKKLREENKERKAKGEKEKCYPESFTTATTYLPTLQTFASMSCTEAPFNSLTATAVKQPLEGCDYVATDGHGAYNVIENREPCQFHDFKNKCKRDSIITKMKKEKQSPAEISRYLAEKYRNEVQKRREEMKAKYPEFVDEKGNFTGAIDTNSMEAANTRLTYALEVPYNKLSSYESRAILFAVFDSIFTFRNGAPEESFAHMHGTFSFNRVMTYEPKTAMRPILRYDVVRGEFYETQTPAVPVVATP